VYPGAEKKEKRQVRARSSHLFYPDVSSGKKGGKEENRVSGKFVKKRTIERGISSSSTIPSASERKEKGGCQTSCPVVTGKKKKKKRGLLDCSEPGEKKKKGGNLVSSCRKGGREGEKGP